jgi:hypothetical protein
MAAPLKTQRTARFARQASVRSTDLRENMNRQESRRIKPKSTQFVTSSCWWMSPQGDWLQCEIVSQDDDTITIKNENAELKVGVSEVLPVNADVVSDMTSLRYLHEPGILSNLGQRLMNKSPYTYMGSILISVNPFEWLAGPQSKEFVGKGMNPDNPHPYAIAGDSSSSSKFIIFSNQASRVMFTTNLCSTSSKSICGHQWGIWFREN